MVLNPLIMRAVEALDYRVTVGDVASQAGLDVKIAERDLLALASEAGGHLQVSEAGNIAYLFPKNFRDVLRNKYWRLRAQAWWNKVWKVLFYLIRVSFGIVLILSIALIVLSILFILAAGSNNRNGNGGGYSSRHSAGNWLAVDWYWLFLPDTRRRSYRRRTKRSVDGSQMNFLEAIFSFLFGDGNPNADLEERRWQSIATVIRNTGGAIVAEQITPYLDNVGTGFHQEYEEYMLPVLVRFNGQPEVSPDGHIIYHFPELQVSAAQHKTQSVSAYLKESPWRFSQATSGQITLAAGLGGLNLVGALMLGSLLRDGTIAAEIGGLVAFTAGIYWILLAYATGFLAIPLIRYFWIQGRNKRIETRNEQRQQRAVALNAADDSLQQKIAFAHQFAAETVVTETDLAYTTTKSLTEQEIEQSDKIDEEWQRRLEQSDS